MNFDIVFTNPPFEYIPEFENIALDQSNQYVWMIAKINHMKDLDKFKKVAYFKNLGREVFKEEIEICSYLIDKDKQDDDLVYVDGLEGKPHQTSKIHLFPGTDVDAWKYAQDVVSLGLSHYKIDGGDLLIRQKKVVNEGGVKCIWSSGGKRDILYDYVDESQKDKLYGLGQHKIFLTARDLIGKLSEIKYASPEEGLSYGCIGIIMESKEICLDVIEYLNSPQVKKLVKGIKMTSHNTRTVWSRIPHHSEKDKWFHLYDA